MIYKYQLLNLNVIKNIKTLNHEEVYAFYYKKINGQMKLTNYFRFGIGDKYEIRNIDYESALRKYKEIKADGLVVVHNHPIPFLSFSKTTKPSYPDLYFTWKLGEICESRNINFIDHIIVSKNGYFSFVEHNLIENMAS